MQYYRVVNTNTGIGRLYKDYELLDSDIFTDPNNTGLWEPLYDIKGVDVVTIENDVWNAVVTILFNQLDYGNTVTIGEYIINKHEKIKMCLTK